MPTPPAPSLQPRPNEPKQAFVRNASDPRQVRFGDRMAKRRVERYAQALAAIMNTPEGRIVMGTVLEHAGIDRSPWTASAEIHYNVGWQDFGRAIDKDIKAVSMKLWQQMQREMWEWHEQEERAIEAEHTKRAGERDDDGRSS